MLWKVMSIILIIKKRNLQVGYLIFIPISFQYLKCKLASGFCSFFSLCFLSHKYFLHWSPFKYKDFDRNISLLISLFKWKFLVCYTFNMFVIPSLA